MVEKSLNLNSKWWYILGGCVLLIIIIMPLFLQNDIITTIKSGSDMKASLALIRGETNYTNYVGQIIITNILKPFANSSHLDMIYLIFSFGLLAMSAFALIFIVKSLVNITSASLVILVAMFCTTGILSLFRYGVIFNLVNMYLILPIAILFAIKGLVKERMLCLEIAVLFFMLFSCFHYTGIYLSPAIALMIMAHLVYCLVGKKKIMLRGVIFGIIVMAINLLILYAGYKKGIAVAFEDELQLGKSLGGYLYYIFMQSINHLSLATLLLLIVAGAWFCKSRKTIKLSTETKLFLFTGISFVAVLFGGLILHLTDNVLYMNRIMVDATTLLAIVVASVLGILLKTQKTNVAYACVYALVGIGVIPVLKVWL